MKAPTMERTYYRRNKPVTVVEHDDLLAVQAAPGAGLTDVLWPGDPTDAQRFRDAGWHLVHRNAWTGESAATTALVLEGPKGRVVLAPNRLVVKFSDSLSRARVDAILAEHDLTTMQELQFATNLRVVASGSEGVVDVIDLANKLRQIEECEFAEPELVESIGARPSAPESQSRSAPRPTAPPTSPSRHAAARRSSR